MSYQRGIGVIKITIIVALTWNV